MRGVPEHIRSDNGAEMTAKVVRNWLTQVGAKTLFIEPGSPWENGFIESFNARLRDELLDGRDFLFEGAGRRLHRRQGLRIFLHRSVRLLCHSDRPHAGWNFNRLQVSTCQVEVSAP